MKWYFALLLFLLFLPSGIAMADPKPYLFTTTYRLADPGENEIEVYSDWNANSDEQGSAEYQIEFERGLNEHHAVEITADFRDEGKGLRLNSYKLENRIHLAPYKKFFLDPAISVEYEKSVGNQSLDALEGNLILSRDFGKWNFSTNLIWDKQLDGSSEADFEYTAGVAHEFKKSSYYSLEFKASPVEKESFIIPGISLPLNEDARFNLGIGQGLGQNSNEHIIRAILFREF
jgi:hypothetical protein